MNAGSIIDRFSPRAQRLIRLLDERVLVVDGAMGTQIQDKGLSDADFGGTDLEGCNEHLALTRPDVIRGIHEAYLAAGADILETNTFGSMPLVLDEYRIAGKAHEISAAAARIAREAADAASTDERPRFVAGALGPTTKSLSLTGGVTYEEMADSYAVALRGLIEGGVDVLMFETALDTLNLKTAFDAADRVFEQLGACLPIMVSVTIENMGTMLAGQDVEAALTSFLHRPLLSFGLNCSTGPEFMTDHLRTLAAISPFASSCIPNAGLPDADGHYNLAPDAFARTLGEFAERGWMNIVGGCCGTTPEHIARLAGRVRGLKPRVPRPPQRTVFSGMETLEIASDSGPFFVGERTNSLGSRKFKRLIGEGKYEEAAEVGRKQVRAGAHVLDICLQNPDRDELADMDAFLDILVRKVKVPLMIDSTDEKVLAASAKKIQGKLIYNSVNLEDGEERFKKVVPLARKYGMALIVGCIDEDKQAGMAVTRARKVEVAVRSHALLTESYGMAEEDLIIDPLVFPCGTGDENYKGSARETIEGVRLIKQALPHGKVTLGISNVSFGLPNAGREVLNSVFLHHCIEVGLDLPIVNTEKVVRYAQISDEDKKVCMDLIDNVGDDPIAAFAEHFRGRKITKTAEDRSKLPIDERLAGNILDGSKEGLTEDLDELLQSRTPLEIINGPLMAGMDEVGRLFNNNELIVAEVLQSAAVMKAAVAHLEPHMEKSEMAARGRVILATVKGDVHDIGKSLVNIIFSNNGYHVIDLGIKVHPEALIQAAREHNPDIIGLSGLLVKSAQQMVTTAEDFKHAGLDVPLLVGGAALSDRFTRTRIAPAYGGAPAIYARDAMNGLDLANQLMDADLRESLWAERKKAPREDKPKTRAGRRANFVAITHDAPAPVPPDLKPHVIDGYDLEDIWRYINPAMLYGKHLGLRGNMEKLLEQGDEKAKELKANVEEVFEMILSEGLCRPQAVYRFFPARGDGQTLTLYRSPPGRKQDDADVAARFVFPRQQADKGWCLSDFVRPSGEDYAALFTVVCGKDVRPRADALNAEGRYLEAHALQAIAIESAEAFAELLHEKLRGMWGIPDPPEMTLQQKFKAQYRGLRVSFGYPACPRLEDQGILFDALKVSDQIDLHLTEEYMMDPEASVSALVFHHPQARYFSVSEDDLKAFEEKHLTKA